MARSGSLYSTPRDANRVPLLTVASTADGVTPVVLEADPTTHALVTSGSGGGTGTQYTQGGATVANPTGTAEIWFDASGNPKAITPSQPLPSNITDGTNSANVLKSDGTAAGENALLTAGTYLPVSFTTTSVQAVGTTDAANYRWVSVQITSQGTSSTVAFQSSNDNTNWVTNPLQSSVTTNSNYSQTTTAAGIILQGAVVGRYFRLNVTGISAGTTAGTIIFSTLAGSTQTMGVSIGTTGQVGANSATGSAVPANAFYTAGLDSAGNLTGFKLTKGSMNDTSGILAASAIAQFDDVSPQTITENSFGNLRISTNRNLYGTIRDAAGNERGANVTAANALVVDGSAVTQPVSLATNTPTLAAGSNLVGKVGIDQTTPGTTNAVVDTPVTSGGLSIVTGSVSATATVIKGSAGQLYGYHFLNTTASVAYVQIFNVAAASVTLGTTVPVISIGIPASGGATVNFDKGIAFSTAISYACTTTRTGLTGATCDVNFFYR